MQSHGLERLKRCIWEIVEGGQRDGSRDGIWLKGIGVWWDIDFNFYYFKSDLELRFNVYLLNLTLFVYSLGLRLGL